MSPPAAEIDFLGIRPQHHFHHLPPHPSPLEIPKTASNTSPDMLLPGVGKPHRPCPVPFLSPSSRSTVEGLRGPRDGLAPTGSPLTIFYHGTVSVFNVPRDIAEAIMTLAERESAAAAVGPRARAEELVVGGLHFSYLPLARQRSLQRFLEKRRERLAAAVPYTAPSALSSTDSDGCNVSSHHKKYGKR